MIRILNAEPHEFSSKASDVLRAFAQLDLRELTREQLGRCVTDYDVLWVRLGFQIDRQILEAGRRLRAVVTPTTGLDHIDVDQAAQRNIDVLSLRGETEFLASIPATAEHTWSLLLALNRNIPAAFQSVREGHWDRQSYRGHDLRGQTLGVVGLGRLGVQVARFGSAFGMRVLAYDPHLARWPKTVIRCVHLEDLLRQCHVLTLHVPLNSETTQMIGCGQLELLSPDAVLINTSRGKVLDSDALLSALHSRRLRGAALDVIPDERRPTSAVRQRLLEYARHHDNLIITPHLAGATHESMASTELFMARKLREHLNCPPLPVSDADGA